MLQKKVNNIAEMRQPVVPREDLSVETRWTNPLFQQAQAAIAGLVHGKLAYMRDGFHMRKGDGLKEAAAWIQKETKVFYARLPSLITEALVKNSLIGDPKDTARLDWLEQKLKSGELTTEYDEERDEYVSIFRQVPDTEAASWGSFREMIDDYMAGEKDS